VRLPLAWHRAFGLGLLAGAGLAVLLLLLARTWADGVYQHAVATACLAGPTASSGCQDALDGFRRQFDQPPMSLLRLLLLTLPALPGVLGTAPLFAVEGARSASTPRGAWRRRLPDAVAFVMVSTFAAGLVVAAAGAYWAAGWAPGQGLWPAFDDAGPALAAYGLFAAAAGIAFGALTARVVPAMLLTAGTFAGVRLAVELLLRPRFMAPLLGIDDPGAGAALPNDVWRLPSAHPLLVDQAGHQSGAFVITCTSTAPCPLTGDVLHAAGVRFGSWYQPADRFWSFQAIEATIFLALAAVLVTLGTWWLARRGRRQS
jgi:hypothetical protein